MAEPLILSQLPEDAAIQDVARQIVERKGEIWEQIEAACNTILAVNED